jgi:cytochrome c-type biogenesis protein
MRIDTLTAWRRPGVLGSFGYGLVFSLGTPVAPLLFLLTIVAAEGRPEHGLVLAVIFGLGRGPFLLAGNAGSAVTGLTLLGLWSRAIQIANGAALMVVSAYYVGVFVAFL